MLDYHVDGDPQNPTLVLIHRGGTLHRMWEPQLEPLSEHYHIIAPDLYYPGKWGDFTIEQAAQDVLAVIAEETTTPVVLVGMALGAAVALQIAATAPERVRGMVLAAPRVHVPNGAMRFNRLLMRLLPRKTVETSHVRQVRKQFPDTSEEAEREMYKLGRPGLLAVSRAMEGLDFSAALPTLTMPIQVITGENSTTTARTAAEVLARRAPQAMLYTLDGAGQWLNQEQPDTFTQVVLEFVNALPEIEIGG